MRLAMSEAEVGDDKSHEDPTIKRLEEMSADILGKEAGLFVVSGTMGNLVSIKTQTRPGQEIICEQRAHIYLWEGGGISTICGLLPRLVPGVDGVMNPDDVEAAISNGSNVHVGATGLVEIENTHNMAGGVAMSVDQTRAICDVAHSHNIPVHCDGARIFNAAIALGADPADLVADVDSVQFCFSKGLGAPVGSMICGTEEFIDQARPVRNVVGGAMRQAGVLAAACIVALEDRDRLHEDHMHARQIADTLVELPGVSVDLATVQTNIVNLEVRREDVNAPSLCRALETCDILAIPRSDAEIRLVTHKQVTDEDTDRVCKALREVLA
ncbi:MAG: aminotransferase class I/II-fold pyridoxal phosphate-dependent enzyme [Armatimonadia bacterium]|nr:aminotransferase class I/II-fold pyridoxal phosphate-dependent enzyme [Armatimonadia bacterium]